MIPHRGIAERILLAFQRILKIALELKIAFQSTLNSFLQQTPLHIKKATCKTGSQMLNSIKITDTNCNLNLMSFCIAAHRMALSGIHFLAFISNTQPDTDACTNKLWTIDN